MLTRMSSQLWMSTEDLPSLLTAWWDGGEKENVCHVPLPRCDTVKAVTSTCGCCPYHCYAKDSETVGKKYLLS